MGLEDEATRMIWEGSPVQAGPDPIVKNSRFPEVVGRTEPEEMVPTSVVVATDAVAKQLSVG